MEKEAEFSKEQILTSNQFTSIEKHFLDALLEEEQSYSLADVKSILKKEKKRKVIK